MTFKNSLGSDPVRKIVKAIRRLRSGTPGKELGRELGVTTATLYAWKKKCNNMTISEAKRLRELESENARLKRLVADQALNIEVLKDINSKKWRACTSARRIPGITTINV